MLVPFYDSTEYISLKSIIIYMWMWVLHNVVSQKNDASLTSSCHAMTHGKLSINMW